MEDLTIALPESLAAVVRRRAEQVKGDRPARRGRRGASVGSRSHAERGNE